MSDFSLGSGYFSGSSLFLEEGCSISLCNTGLLLGSSCPKLGLCGTSLRHSQISNCFGSLSLGGQGSIYFSLSLGPSVGLCLLDSSQLLFQLHQSFSHFGGVFRFPGNSSSFFSRFFIDSLCFGFVSLCHFKGKLDLFTN